jgi:hypothetical protein
VSRQANAKLSSEDTKLRDGGSERKEGMMAKMPKKFDKNQYYINCAIN